MQRHTIERIEHEALTSRIEGKLATFESFLKSLESKPFDSVPSAVETTLARIQEHLPSSEWISDWVYDSTTHTLTVSIGDGQLGDSRASLSYFGG